MSSTINNPFIEPFITRTTRPFKSTRNESATITETSTTILTSSSQNSTIASSILALETTESTLKVAKIEQKEEAIDDDDYSITEDVDPQNENDDEEAKNSTKQRRKRESEIWGKLIPGACLKGCSFGFFAFAIVSSIINCLGVSARIGNLLVNYRCVSKQDKSVTQGLILMLISLFALIPGPIMYGKIIDSTCLVWTEQCSGSRGNCQLYDQRKFRYYINLTAFALTTIGVFFDFLVWKHGRNLDLYGEREEEMLKKQRKRNWSDNNNTTVQS